MKKLLILLIPILEILLFIKIGSLIGLLGTLIAIFLTGIVGIFIIKNAGVKNVFNSKNPLNQNNHPIDNIFKGICYIISGILLIIPGYITDLMGLLLLIPYVRYLIKYLPFLNLFFNNFNQTVNNEETFKDQTIEGEFSEIDINDKIDK